VEISLALLVYGMSCASRYLDLRRLKAGNATTYWKFYIGGCVPGSDVLFKELSMVSSFFDHGLGYFPLHLIYA